VQILYPSQQFTKHLATQYQPADEHFVNNRSLILLLRYGNISFLFTGDLEIEGEQALIASHRAGLQATVLKVPHHGSRTSSSETFLQAVQPEVAVFSVGEFNWHRLPDPQILSRYHTGSRILLRTDQQGAIEIVTDGQDYTIRTYAAAEFSPQKNY
jgi:competence protein ComEC